MSKTIHFYGIEVRDGEENVEICQLFNPCITMENVYVSTKRDTKQIMHQSWENFSSIFRPFH
jgi:hypothetical protein